MKKQIRKRYFDLDVDFDLDWAHYSYQLVIRLFDAKYLPITDQTEAEFVHRIWSFIDTVFGNISIDVRWQAIIRYFRRV